MPRNPLQQKIQIARRQLGIEEDDYRALLTRVTGQNSTKGMGPKQLQKVLDAMAALGFEERRGKRQQSPHAYIRFIHVLWSLLADAGVVDRDRSALNAFIQADNFREKWGELPTDVDWLTQERAYDVIEALKAIARRHRVELQR
ncbi:MAG: regulatory protein GemA [Pseudomonadota bacterium]